MAARYSVPPAGMQCMPSAARVQGQALDISMSNKYAENHRMIHIKTQNQMIMAHGRYQGEIICFSSYRKRRYFDDNRTPVTYGRQVPEKLTSTIALVQCIMVMPESLLKLFHSDRSAKSASNLLGEGAGASLNVQPSLRLPLPRLWSNYD